MSSLLVVTLKTVSVLTELEKLVTIFLLYCLYPYINLLDIWLSFLSNLVTSLSLNRPQNKYAKLLLSRMSINLLCLTPESTLFLLSDSTLNTYSSSLLLKLNKLLRLSSFYLAYLKSSKMMSKRDLKLMNLR
jgi:hypothetical protein